MDQLLIWLSNRPAAATAILATLVLSVVSLVVFYAIAFFQGRSIRIWPPSIGRRPSNDSRVPSKRGKKPLMSRASPIVSGIDAYLQINLTQCLKTLRSLDLAGYNLRSLLDDLREPMVDAIRRGAIVRVLIVDPAASAARLMERHSNRPQLLRADAAAALGYVRDVQRLVEATPLALGRLEVKLTSWIPSCSMILVDASEDTGTALIGIHPPSFRKPRTGRLSLILSHDTYPSELDYFVKQFAALWEDDSREWDGVIPEVRAATSQE